MKNLPILFVVTALFTSIAFSRGAVDQQSIRDLIARYAQAREERDPKAIDALFTRDADQLVSSGEWRDGREELVSGMLESSRRSSGKRTITVEKIRFISDKAAVADARYVIVGRPGEGDRKMWSTFILVSTLEGWRITAIRNMLPAK